MSVSDMVTELELKRLGKRGHEVEREDEGGEDEEEKTHVDRTAPLLFRLPMDPQGLWIRTRLE